MLLLELSLYPLDKGISVGQYVSQSLEIIDKSGLDYQATSMGTIMEGEWDEVFDVVKKCFEKMKESSSRVELVMKGDWREGPKGRLISKVESAEKTLHHSLRKQIQS